MNERRLRIYLDDHLALMVAVFMMRTGRQTRDG